jgi:hypothetical protein
VIRWYFDADVAPHSVIVQVGFDVVVVGGIVAEIAVELAIVGIARVADLRAPDLLARLGVPGEDGDSVVGDHRRVDAAARPRDCRRGWRGRRR